MSNEPPRLAVIVSSVREGRFGAVAGEWFAGQAGERGDLTVDVVDPAEHELPAALSHNPSPEVTEALSELPEVSPRPEQADAFVVMTPEYDRSFAASLKHLIDRHYTRWRAKPVDETTGPAGAAKVLLDQLAWWGTALREGRADHRYQA